MASPSSADDVSAAPAVRARLPSMRVACEDWRPKIPPSPEDPHAWAASRADLIDRVVRTGADVATANALTGVCPPLTAGEVESRACCVSIWRRQLGRLLADPGIAQRTPEWYSARMSLITASDVAQALACAKFGNQRQFFQKKCGLPDEQAPFDSDLPPLQWGIKYEPVAQAVYSASRGATVHEFGLIRHPTIPHLGASPDGVTDLGVMLEIKCPWRRRIVDGEIPLQYYHQIQAQLEVCGLGECDYFECEFDEADARADEFEHRLPFEHGVLVENVDNATGARTYAYPVPAAGLPIDDLNTWVAQQLAAAPQARARWWTVRKRSCIRVPFDPAFVANMLPRLSAVWQRVLEYRADRDRYVREVGVPQPRKARDVEGDDDEGVPPTAPLTQFAFVDSE